MSDMVQSKYMDLNEFLEIFFTAMDNNEPRIGYFPNVVKDSPNLQNLQETLYNFHDLGPNSIKLFQHYWNARNDNSPEAADFLNMIKTITIWYAENYNRQGLGDSCKTIMHLCKNEKIKKPEFALRLLKTINEQFDRNQPIDSLQLEINNMIATNLAAHPIDAYRYSAALLRAQSENRKYDMDAPEELMGILNDQMVKTDANIDKELSKDFPNTNNIQNIGGGTLVNFAENILRLAEYQVKHGQRDQADLNEIREIVAQIRDKYNIDNILGLEQKPYGPRYEEQASLRLAKIQPQYKQMERELDAAQKREAEWKSKWQNEQKKSEFYKVNAHLAETKANETASKLDKLGRLMENINQTIKDSGGLPIKRLHELQELIKGLSSEFESSKQDIANNNQKYNQEVINARQRFTSQGGRFEI